MRSQLDVVLSWRRHDDADVFESTAALQAQGVSEVLESLCKAILQQFGAETQRLIQPSSQVYRERFRAAAEKYATSSTDSPSVDGISADVHLSPIVPVNDRFLLCLRSLSSHLLRSQVLDTHQLASVAALALTSINSDSLSVKYRRGAARLLSRALSQLPPQRLDSVMDPSTSAADTSIESKTSELPPLLPELARAVFSPYLSDGLVHGLFATIGNLVLVPAAQSRLGSQSNSSLDSYVRVRAPFPFVFVAK